MTGEDVRQGGLKLKVSRSECADVSGTEISMLKGSEEMVRYGNPKDKRIAAIERAFHERHGLKSRSSVDQSWRLT